MLKNWDKNTKEKISYCLATLSFIVGVILIFCGLFLEPVGEIHASVLGGVGTFLTFAGSLLGISLHYNTELENFKTTVEKRINRDNDEMKTEENE